jgi:hypothetical protein
VVLSSACFLQGILRHIRVLECVAGGVRLADQGMETAAQQGVSVLNSLHGLLSSASEDSTPQGLGQSQHAVLAGNKSCLEAVSALLALPVAQSRSAVYSHVALELCSSSLVHAGRQHTAILMRLLLASLRPKVDSLQLWAEEGLVVNHLSEALVCQGGTPRGGCHPEDSWCLGEVLSHDQLIVCK